MSRSYEDLLVWQKSIELADRIYDLTNMFPKEEMYGLSQQMRRSAVSIPSNIAEGCARHFKNEFVQFIAISSGSLAELHTQAIIASKRNFLKMEEYKALDVQMIEVRRMLNGLKASLTDAPNRNPRLNETRNPQLATGN